MKSQRLILNISGEIYETMSSTLQRFPTTLLGDRSKRALYYCKSTNEYFFQRSKLFFDAIIFFYQSNGILRCPIGLPLELFEEECRFFQIPECFIRKLRPLEAVDNQEEEEVALIKSEMKGPITTKSKLWNFLRNPEWSSNSWWFSVFSLVMIFLSVISSCLETLPSLKMDISVYEHDPWTMAELILNVWFLLELSLCLISTPDKREFLRSTLTWIDIIAVIPYFVVLTISKNAISSLSFLKIVRLFRVTRMFHLSKYSSRLKIVGHMLTTCVDEFKTLVLCFMVSIVLAGSIIYFIEDPDVYPDTYITDIPTGLYWGIQTITTLGYGDIYPLTSGGMLFASTFMVFGAITMCLPVITIVSKFETKVGNH